MATQFLGTRYQSFKSDGTINNGGTVQFFEPNTSTHKQTYSDSSLTTENADPVVLNSAGCADIWYSGNADVTVYDSTGSIVDSFEDINPTELNEWVDGPAPTYVSATSFTLVGNQTNTFHVGRRVKTTNTGGTVYSTISAVAFTTVTTVTVVNDSGTLDSGLSFVQYSVISATNTSLPLGGSFNWSGNFNWSGISTFSGTIAGATPFVFEGTTSDAYETSLAITDPTADRTLTVQDLTGTISLCEPIIGASKGFTLKRNATNPNYQLDLAATAIVLHNTSNLALQLQTWSLTVDITASGANGLDTGAEANSTWYYVWAIYDGTNKRGLISTSSTAPTMPSGYTYKALVGAVYNSAGGNFLDFYQTGRDVYYAAAQSVLSAGVATTDTAITISGFVPTIAEKYKFHFSATNTGATDRVVYFGFIASNDAMNARVGGSTTGAQDTASQVEFPNISQGLYYHFSSVSSSSVDVYINGFTI